MKPLGSIPRSLYGLGAVILLWYLAAMAVRRPIVPFPHATFLELVDLFGKGRMLADAGASLIRVLAGMACAFLAGVPLGLLLGKNALARRAIQPLVYALFPVPKIAFLPVFMVLFGLGDASKIALLFTIIVFHIIIAVGDATREISVEYYHAMRALGLRSGQLYRHLVFPAVLPRILSSLKLSAGTALSVLFFAENYATNRGLGAFVMNAWIMADYPGMYAGICVLASIGLGMFALIDALERRFCPWMPVHNGT